MIIIKIYHEWIDYHDCHQYVLLFSPSSWMNMIARLVLLSPVLNKPMRIFLWIAIFFLGMNLGSFTTNIKLNEDSAIQLPRKPCRLICFVNYSSLVINHKIYSYNVQGTCFVLTKCIVRAQMALFLNILSR